MICTRCLHVRASETWNDEPVCEICFEGLARPDLTKSIASMMVKFEDLRAEVSKLSDAICARDMTEHIARKEILGRLEWMESKLVNHIALGSGADTWSNDEA